ncbi:MAG: hypothetical protein IPL61_22900 [Myxococcales bacterium]|nr:hypothetical protein [Myxococcales bacterium]
MVRGIVATGLLALAACQFPRPADVPGDAGPDAPTDAPIDARPDLVTGRIERRYATPAGVVDVGSDLSLLTVQAVIPSGQDAFTIVSGVARADGTFEIEGVPPGPYILKAGRTAHATDRHEVTLRTTVPARPAQLTTMATPIDLQLGGLVPVPSSYVSIISGAAGVEAIVPLPASPASLAQTLDWATASPLYSGGPPPLPDARMGDDLTIAQYRVTDATTLGALRVEEVVAAAAPSAVTLYDGVGSAVSDTLGPVTARLTPGTVVSRALLDQGHSTLSAPSSLRVRCVALPVAAGGWSVEGAAIDGPMIMSVGVTDFLGGATATLPLATYADPFPAAWQRYCKLTYARARAVRVPGASPTQLTASTVRLVNPAGLALTPMSPPTAIRVDGLDAESGGVLRNDGRPVSVTWTGASQASQYNVSVYQLRAQGGATVQRLAVSITTSTPVLTIPAELLAGSDFITFVVTASMSSNTYAAGNLFPEGVPGAASTTVTAMFRFSSTCGDSTVDVGEACDEGSATATCDADCTSVECGDGTRNAAAGELCDAIVDTPGCDSDCSANICGDGHRNPTTEQCDDGNTMSGDGCSAACRTE